MFKLFFSSKGRISRKTYLFGATTALAIICSSSLLIQLSSTIAQTYWLRTLLVIFLLVISLAAWFSNAFCLTIKRFHDLGKSGFYLLLCFIPFVNFYFAYLLFFKKGSSELNLYGDNPLASQNQIHVFKVVTASICYILVIALYTQFVELADDKYKAQNSQINILNISKRSQHSITQSLNEIYNEFKIKDSKKNISLKEGLNQNPLGKISNRSTFLLISKNRSNQESFGSGFALTKNLIVTNYHVIEDTKYIGDLKGVKIVSPKGQTDVGFVLLKDEANDLAIIRSRQSNYIPIPLGNYENVLVGDPVSVISSPRGLVGTLSQGIISSKRVEENKKLLQITAPISPGSSGSPILSKGLEVIGISRSMLENSQNLNFAIPVIYLKELIDKNKDNLLRFDRLSFLNGIDHQPINNLNSVDYKKFFSSLDLSELSYLDLLTIKELSQKEYQQAQYYLGYIYFQKKDYINAFNWYKKSAQQGNASAQYSLSLMHFRGQGTKQHYGLSYSWSNVSYLSNKRDSYKKMTEIVKTYLTQNDFITYHNYSINLFHWIQKQESRKIGSITNE